MPHDFDTVSRQYRTAEGRPVSHSETRTQIDKLIDFVEKEAARIAERYWTSKNIVTFEIEMRELLKAAHIVAASVGRGGRSRMTAADWGRVGQKIKWQYDFLAKFARKIATGKIMRIASTARARSYASAIYISYAKTFKESQTEGSGGNGNRPNGQAEMLCRLITNSVEGCSECAADEDEGWIPVSEMKELGDRICGDFCRCVIEFEDEI